jgi:DNA-binding CsgD family transcriptional regulator
VTNVRLLDRSQPLERLEATITAAAGGRGSVVVVSGEPGIGKTALLGHAAANAGGLRVLTARGGELERQYAYGAVRQLFEGAIAGAEGLFSGAAGSPRASSIPPSAPRPRVPSTASPLRAGRRRDAGHEALREGMDLASRCGAAAIAARAREELIAGGARPRRDALRGRDALTAGELRVARMAAEGLANREIAQALFITTKTVETHLGNVYSKLSVPGRRALAPALAA